MVVSPDVALAQLALARQERDESVKIHNQRWRQGIVTALESGASVPSIALVAGCTRQRVYQIQYEEKNLVDSRGRHR